MMKCVVIVCLTLLAVGSPRLSANDQFSNFTNLLVPKCSQTWLMHSGGPYFQPPGPNGPGGIRDKMFRKKFERLERLRMEKMFEVLQLEPEQKGRMLEFMKGHRARQEELFNERSQIMDELRDRIHADKFDEPAVNDLLNKLESLERRQYEHRALLIEEVKKMLTTEQIARLVLFMEHFESNIFEKVRGLRSHEGGKSRRNMRENQKQDIQSDSDTSK